MELSFQAYLCFKTAAKPEFALLTNCVMPTFASRIFSTCVVDSMLFVVAKGGGMVSAVRLWLESGAVDAEDAGKSF